MAYATAHETDATQIPVVDITPLRNGENPQSVANALHAASQNLGFIYIKGHGIPDVLIQSARQQAFAFFRQPDSEKEQVRVSPQHRGWLKPGAAKMADKAKADLKESFIWGHPMDRTGSDSLHSLQGPNQWPASVPLLADVAMDYFDAAHQVAYQLMKGFALGLGLNEDFFLQQTLAPLSRASFVYYPPQPEHSGEDQFGVAPHTDFGVLTVLCQDHTGGLQVEDRQGRWIHAPPVDGTLVVNVGDLLSRWTGGAYKSTPHRVVNASGQERLSLVLAFDPDANTMIDAAGIPGIEAKDDPITCGDYLEWRFAKAFAYRKTS
jgi:isopenicillin N synthase-like dioxygenase